MTGTASVGESLRHRCRGPLPVCKAIDSMTRRHLSEHDLGEAHDEFFRREL